MLVVAASAVLPPTGIGECMYVFDEMDQNQNGTLDQAEVLSAVSRLLPGANHQLALKYAYRAADDDDDGLIDENEFILLARHLVYLNNIWNLFDATDVDGDRGIDLDEFGLGCSMLNLAISDADAQAEFAALGNEQVRQLCST